VSCLRRTTLRLLFSVVYPFTLAEAWSEVRTEALPKGYGMLLFQSFETLDVFGPLDALRILSRQYKMDLVLIR
jgi:hypothetical protein